MKEWQNILTVILPIITLLIGTLLGLFTTFITSRIQQRNSIATKVLEQYFKAREDICERLSDLASLQISPQFDEAGLQTAKEDISKLYYKYYDFLPVEVLREMNCLYACLSDKKNRIYRDKANRLLPIEDSELEVFIEQISMVDNFKYYAIIPLKSLDEGIRRSASVNYQARSVLRAINKYFTLQDLSYWAKHLPKHIST